MKTPAQWSEQIGICCEDRSLEQCEDQCRFGCVARQRIVRDAVNEALECAALMLDADAAKKVRALKHPMLATWFKPPQEAA
jgi:hypothetical protein